ncbi:MAG: hypothetical protein JO219_10875 [Candidatus Eremiobacteraeota bacterium]|nr:hypothetical protein [Candidatus Eremiobacteraeota bacterium]
MRISAYQDQGIDQAQHGKIDAAIGTWHTAYRYLQGHCYPDSPDYVQPLLAMIEAGDMRGAFAHFHSYSELPMYQDIGAAKPFAAGVDAGTRGNYTAAAEQFRNALHIDQKAYGRGHFPDADFMLGLALYAQGKHADATRQWALALGDYQPAYPPDGSGPDGLWLVALALYEKKSQPPF